MTSFEYIVPVSYTAEDDETFSQKKTFYLKDCSIFTSAETDSCSQWSLDKCPSDRNYCQPFIKGDKIYFQFPYKEKTYDSYDVELINTDTETVISPFTGITAQTGKSTEKTNVLNVVIDTTDLDYSCFLLRIKFHRIIDYPGEYIYVYSEPFCEVRCEQKTILLQGTYKEYDCNGNFYGTFLNGQQSIYKSIFRVRGEIVKIGFDFEETKSTTPKSNYTTKSRTVSRYRVYISKVPPYVAEQLAQVFGGQNVYIDSVQYEKPSRMNKDFDEGQSWIPLLELSKSCEEIDFTCE